AVEPAHRIDDTETRSYRPLGIVLMRPRVAEISQDSVAHVFRDKAVEPANDLSDGAMIGGDDLAQILRVESCGEPGEPTRSQNITVSCRRSASAAADDGSGAGAAGDAPSPRAAIAASSRRRSPTAATPMSFRSAVVSSDSTSQLIAFSS